MKLWGGRFSSSAAAAADSSMADKMEKLNSSLHVDKRLFRQDIEGSIAYASALHECGILTNEELEKMQKGLNILLKEWEHNPELLPGPSSNMDGILSAKDEDVHSFNERRLGELIGKEIAGKLHTARSRNDQVATDTRMWLISSSFTIITDLRGLVSTLLDSSARDIDLIMPGYTHLQRAQPIRYSQFLLCHATSLSYTLHRFISLLATPGAELRACPLGSGALAGSPLPKLNRSSLAHSLRFPDGPSINSMNSVMSRDFILDFLYCCCVLGLELSRFAEDLIIYASSEFGMVTLADAYSTGSSLMPQKKNPDSLELVRGKSGFFFGLMSGFMMTCKGLPSTYNKDLQDDKKYMFDAFDTATLILQVMTGVVSTLKPNEKRMKENLSVDMLATDLADEMVRLGLPFREAHHKSGELVSLAEKKSAELSRKVTLSELSLSEFRSVFPLFKDEIVDPAWWSFEASVERRGSTGGTSKQAIINQITNLRNTLDLS